MVLLHRMMGTWKNTIDVYIALTEFGRRKFVEGGLPPERIEVKPNFLTAAPEPGSGSGGYAVFVGRLSEVKGVKTLLAAWEQLGSRLPLKVLGDGPLSPDVREAEKRISGLGLLGWLPREQTLEILGEAAFLIFPSEWYEGLPLAIIESLAKGTPVIASRLGVMPEIIDHGHTGFLFRAGDPLDLVAQVKRALGNKDQLREMRIQARREFESKYTAERNYQLLTAIYGKALARNSERRRKLKATVHNDHAD